MSNSNRIISTAFGLIVASNIIALKAEEIAPNQIPSGDKAQRALVQNSPVSQAECGSKASDGSQKTGQFDGSSFTLNCGGDSVTSKKDEEASAQRERDDLVAQQSVAESTRLIVGFTLLQFILSALGLLALLYSLRQTNRAVAAAEKTLSNSERPYIAIDIRKCVFEPAHVSQEGIADLWMFDFKNIGPSPARLARIEVRIAYLPANEVPPKIDPKEVGGEGFPHGIFVEHNGIAPAICYRFEGHDQIRSQRLIDEELYYCWIFGFIRYQSISGDGYITGFCMRNRNGGILNEASVVGGSDYNYISSDDFSKIPSATNMRSGDSPIRL